MITDARLKELREACIHDEDKQPEVVDIDGLEMRDILDELAHRRGEGSIPTGVDPTDELACRLAMLVDSAQIDEVQAMLSLDLVIASIVNSSRQWKPYTAVCALIDLLAHKFELKQLDVLAAAGKAMVQKLARDGDEDALLLARAHAQAQQSARPRTGRPRRTVTVGRRFKR